MDIRVTDWLLNLLCEHILVAREILVSYWSRSIAVGDTANQLLSFYGIYHLFLCRRVPRGNLPIMWYLNAAHDIVYSKPDL